MKRRSMRLRITIITLGVDNLETSLSFYKDGLGLATKGIVGAEFEYGAVALFALQSGLILALYPRKSLAKGQCTPRTGAKLHGVLHRTQRFDTGEGRSGDGRRVAQALGSSSQRGRRFGGGYAGYFQNPDGHLMGSRLESREQCFDRRRANWELG